MNRPINNTLRPILAVFALVLSATAHAGDPTGPNYGQDVVQAADSNVYHLRFAGNEMAAVYLQGDGDTDLDLFVYDAAGDLACEDIDATDEALCMWVPDRTQTYRIEVANLGGVYNAFTIQTN